MTLRLLPLRGRPEAEVALPLQRDALAVEAPCDRHVSIESAEGGGVERLEPEQRRAAEQRRVDAEVRVLGGGADQDDQPLLQAGFGDF